MKARVIAQKPLVLYYGLDDEKKHHAKAMFERFRLDSREILKEDTSQQIGFLAGWNGFSKNNEEVMNPPEMECLVFCQLDQTTLNRLVTAMRQSGIGVDLKAIVTQYNQSWKFCDLVVELEKEHKMMNTPKE